MNLTVSLPKTLIYTQDRQYFRLPCEEPSAISVGIACMQSVWRIMRRTYTTIEGIDAAFAMQGSILSFLNWEMMSKVKVGTLIALVM